MVFKLDQSTAVVEQTNIGGRYDPEQIMVETTGEIGEDIVGSHGDSMCGFADYGLCNQIILQIG